MYISQCDNREVGKMRMRRRDTRIWFMALGLFAAVFLFTFLSHNYKKIDEDVQAANLANFNPGYIISDFQMGNYQSMTEAEIQAFLTMKNPCDNTDYNYYLRLSANPNYTWHFENGHFICISEEKFGDGEIIGSGDTAAHIIWQAAQDYQINPQVLLVLLQKETGLITDRIPNNGDYRKATGYGCPDTAPCSAQYYGFKNQIRKAAALFRTVLDGGWTNYPLGENYIQYNPNAACGGSVVNIKNLATSSLYRYTPYQPNAAALAAGYGTAYCGAYGNRNFYHYFEDWFGGILDEEVHYEAVERPRYMVVLENTNFLNSRGEVVKKAAKGNYYKFTTKTQLPDERWCLRTEKDTKNKIDACLVREEVGEPEYEDVVVSRLMVVKKDTHYIDPNTLEELEEVSKGEVFMFPTKIMSNTGEWCIRTKEDTKEDINRCLLRSDIDNTENYAKSDIPRYMKITKDTTYIVPHTMGKLETIEAGTVFKFTTKILDANGKWCIRTEEDANEEINRCIMRSDLANAENYQKSDKPRQMKTTIETNYIVPHTLETLEVIEAETVFNFTTKIKDSNGEWCIRTEEDSINDINACIPRSKLSDV